MSRFAAATVALVCLSLCSIGWGDPAQQKKEPTPRAKRAQEIRNRLAAPITLERGIEANTTLKDAMESLSDQTGVQIVSNTMAFKQDAMIESVDDQTVRLPKIIGVKFSTVLRLVADQVGGTYRLRGDHIEIIPRNRLWPQVGFEWVPQRQFAPIVDAEFRNQELSAALQELADESGTNIVLDARSAEKVKTPITAVFNGVPIDTAVELIANMAGLKSVVLDRAIYVTTPENAKRLEVEYRATVNPPGQA
jgi:hypothetical protein